MKSIKVLKVVAASCALAAGVAAPVANAAPIAAPVPTNAFISQGGLDWAWANPMPAAFGLDLSFQSTFGWRIPTAAELLSAPLATDFLIVGGNVPFMGADPVSGASFQATNAAYTSDGACATAYFSTSYMHCDWQDGLGQTWGPWAGMQGAQTFADQLVVRNSNQVPEPGTLALLGLAVAGLAFRANRRKQDR